MPSNDLSKARLELANFPQEVFDQWITPFVLTYGWPFKTGAQRSIKTAWAKVFWRKDVGHWHNEY